MLAHANYARSSAPLSPAVHFKSFRFSNLSAAPGRQRCFARGLARWCKLVGVTPICSTGTALFCRQGVGGFGTDPQMLAVQSIASVFCFHIEGSHRDCPVHPGLPPFPLPCPHRLHTNCVAWSLFKSRRPDGTMSARRHTFSSASRGGSMYPCLNLASAVGIIDFARLPNSLCAGLVFRPSVGVLRRLSRVIYECSQ